MIQLLIGPIGFAIILSAMIYFSDLLVAEEEPDNYRALSEENKFQRRK
ncbi:MAG: hypothetical protein NXI00_22560 [Cytophagales bacterium]|nr:hypothetical protein [Cytophagales bacterium]